MDGSDVMRRAGLAISFLLAACSSPRSEAAPAAHDRDQAPVTAASPKYPAPRPGPAVILAPDGLVTGGRLLRFGIARAEIERAVGKAQGAALESGSSSECGAGTVDFTRYRDELQLTFQNGKFAGWTINGAASPLKTAKDIGIGSPRQSLDAAYPDVIVDDSSLGLLFSTGDLVGLLDQDGIEGIVTDIWAGTVCLVD